MKAVFMNNPHFYRQSSQTMATVFELGEPVVEGDVMVDVVNGKEHVISGRGFSPTRSSNTSYRNYWSREVAIVLSGDCSESDGRLLIAAGLGPMQCYVIKGRIEDKSHLLPVETPIVGTVRILNHNCSAILVVDEKLKSELLLVVSSKTLIKGALLDFTCVNPEHNLVDVRMIVSVVNDAPQMGKLLDWPEEDVPIKMK